MRSSTFSSSSCSRRLAGAWAGRPAQGPRRRRRGTGAATWRSSSGSSPGAARSRSVSSRRAARRARSTVCPRAVDGFASHSRLLSDAGEPMINGSPTKLDTLQIDYLYDENGVPYGGLYREPATRLAGLLLAADHRPRRRGRAARPRRRPLRRLSLRRLGQPDGASTQTRPNRRDQLRPGGRHRRPPGAALRLLCLRSESGLYYLSARSYDPVTAQFISPDLAKADGEESAYQYCRGEPVGSVDPSGTYGVRLSPKMFADNTAYFKLVLRRDAGWARIGIGYAGTIYWEWPTPYPGRPWDFKYFYGRTRGLWYGDCWLFLNNWISPATSATFTSATSALRCGFRRT